MTIGRTLGRYELVSKIGGGAVERWLANQSGVGKLVEVRLVAGADAEAALERARIVAQIEHANLVTVLDVGSADGTHFVVTEHVEGETLAGIVEAGRSGKRLDEFGLARILADVAEGLDAAHEHVDGDGTPYHLVHRRLSPSTVLVQYNGQVKVAALDALGAGPLAYAAPERLDSADAIGDRRGDVFALGALLWEALTQERLFDAGDDDAVKHQVRNAEIVSPAELNANVPAPLADICLRALSRDPEARQPTAKRLALDLEELLTQAAYSRRNDRLASYMAEAFAEHITAKRQRSGKVTSPPIAKAAAASSSATLPAAAPVAAPTPSPDPTPTPTPTPSPDPTPTPTPTPTPDPTPATVTGIPIAVPDTSSGVPTAPTPISTTTTMLGIPVPRLPLLAATPSPSASSSAEVAPSPRVTLPLGSTGAGVATAVDAAEPVVEPPVRPTPQPRAPTPAPVANGDALPNPAGVVTLSTKDVVEGWEWSTGTVQAVREEDEYDDPPHSDRKPLLIAIGAAGAVIAIIGVIAVAMGGSREAEKKPTRAALPATQSETAAPPAPTPTPAPAGSADVVAPVVATTDPGSGSAASVVAAGSGSATAGSAAVAALDLGSGSAAGSAAPAVAALTGSAGSAAIATLPKPTPPPVPVTPPPPPRPRPVVVQKPPPPRVARKPEPKPVDPYAKPTPAPADAAASYKAGFQAFVHGDNATALTALHASISANPSFAPAWRVLGLVLERTGERDQARAAFRRYLALSPNAGDADQIRDRLEKLGS